MPYSTRQNNYVKMQHGLILVAQTNLEWKVWLVHVDKILAAVWIKIYQFLIYKYNRTISVTLKF